MAPDTSGHKDKFEEFEGRDEFDEYRGVPDVPPTSFHSNFPSMETTQGGTLPEDLPDEHGPIPDLQASQPVSYLAWCSKLTKLVLRTRTAFSAFLAFSIRISKSLGPRGRLAPAFFPIPVPVPGIFGRMAGSPSRKKCASLTLHRVVHVISMAMNFWHFGGIFRSEEELSREPNARHRRFFSLVRSLVKSDGLSTSFDFLRRNPEIFARLYDLVETFLSKGCSSNPYDRSFQGFEVPRRESRYPELQPCRDLEPSRLKVSGKAQWDISDCLSENLAMAYREPEVLKLKRTPEPWEFPRLRDDQATVCQLARLWDLNGLLFLHREGVKERPDYEKVRIFNAYKNETTDHQIGDRRGRNAVEAVVKGPSSNLPGGADLCDLVVNPKTQRLAISISDRKDYYHQIKVAKRRAIANTLGPGLPAAWLEGTQAYEAFLMSSSSRRRYDRLRDGDRLGQSGLEDQQTPVEETAAYGAYSLAQEAYASAGLLGSPEKDKRPMMALFEQAFLLVSNEEAAAKNHVTIALPRAIAQELTLVSVLAPLLMTNLAAGYGEFAFATDASEEKGASRITEFVCSFGITCGPPIDISISEEYNLKAVHVVAWVTHLLAEKVLKAVLLMPPYTTFSIMRRPPLRDMLHPFGFDPSDRQTQDGNILAQRSFQIGHTAAANEAIAIVEKPHSSKMRYLPSWQQLLQLDSSSLVRADSCQFGSIHRKSFSFLGINVDLAPIGLRCQGTCIHIPVQGSYTKASATYVPKLAYGLAHCIAHGIFSMRQVAKEQDFEIAAGLENQLVNEVMLSSKWEVLKSWQFKACTHINLLELKAAERLVESQAKVAFSLRFISMVDSNVSRGALGKGRSASRAISHILRRINSMLVAADLYMINPFCPTRLNVADDPTRDRELRESSPGLLQSPLSREQVFALATMPRLRRWASNWARLILLMGFPTILSLGDRSKYRRSSIHKTRQGFRASPRLDFSCLDFDSTLGYPGEGPASSFIPFGICPPSFFILLGLVTLCILASTLEFGFCPSAIWILPFILPPGRVCSLSASSGCLAVGCLGSFIPGAEAMVLGTQTGNELRKAAERAARPSLPEGRAALEVTTRLRERYWRMFLEWAEHEGIDFDRMLRSFHLHIEEINLVLSKYGRLLYSLGKPYTVYAETISMLTSKKPVLRRQLQGAWDLAFNWVQSEPSCHHVAMPWQILLAMVTVSLMWGWTEVSGCIALGWGALLRAGEVLAAKRRDLLLPRDVEGSIKYALLAINEPKTRYTGPRHQAAKLDVPDLLLVTDLAFGEKPENAKLWEKSGQTLRLRFKEILRELCLPVSKYNGMKPP
eukprot:s1085_g5.t1